MTEPLSKIEGLSAGARVVAAMSGGVDSALAAALAKEQGFDVVGLTLQLYDHGAARGRKGACCAGEDIHDARRVAERLGIAHYVLDFEARFRESVMVDFAETYARGETPVPCVRCNERVKFRDLVGIARELGAEALVTGHYARRVLGAEGPELHSARDGARDQSYFLFATTPAQLSFLRFPLGELTKRAVRAAAEARALPVAQKPDSQDICFVPVGRYVSVVERLRPGAAEPGQIVDLEGRVLGAHPGVIHFTVGQRRGLNLSGGAPLFVVALDAKTRRVIVGTREALLCRALNLREVNFLGGAALQARAKAESIPVAVKVRSTRPPVPAHLLLRDGGMAEVEIADGEEGVAPGQACVFYERNGTRGFDNARAGTRVLGGGFIATTDRASLRARAVAAA
jgi:tRNA-specific 2-thiouridylase